MNWYPFEGTGLSSPLLGWVLFALLWAAMFLLERWSQRIAADSEKAA